jgi:hypothetical protein
MTSFCRPAALLAMLVVSGAALAGQADICYSAGAATSDVEKLTSSTPLNCPAAGTHTLSELAQGGWSVVSVQPVTTEYDPGASGDAPRSRSAWMLVIQKGGK